MMHCSPRRVGLVFLSACSCLTLTAVLDRVFSFFLASAISSQTQSLVFPARSTASYRTPEFRFTARINSLGFRDHEFETPKRTACRIAALGDSFTYGWGVDISETWVKTLERNLQAKGHKVEVANLGRGGDYPAKYAEIAEKAVPVLRPDLVLVAVLQGDDLAQCEESLHPSPAAAPPLARHHPAVRRAASAALRLLYPNLLAMTHRPARISAADITVTWMHQAEKIVLSAAPAGRERFAAMETRVRNAYLHGELNPGLLRMALEDPDYFLHTLHTNDSKTASLIEEMARQLSRIQNVAARYGATTVVVSVPYRIYVDYPDWLDMQRLGFHADPAMLASDKPDQAIQLACRKAGLPFYSVTDRFREEARRRRLYFELDGHFNAEAHRLYGDLLVPVIESQASRTLALAGVSR
jgi:lysophospholipase L1-like esterase